MTQGEDITGLLVLGFVLFVAIVSRRKAIKMRRQYRSRMRVQNALAAAYGDS
jgi:hypothetical protein